ncbi:MAG: DUF4340 domain-containing protein [Clostridia bacterium]|nr:DUF4340 domain-containing protein [Clostridia bacterium]
MDNKDFDKANVSEQNTDFVPEQDVATDEAKKSEPLIIENSTIFTAPTEQKKEKVKKGKYVKLIALLLAFVIILTGGIFAAIHFLPEKTEGEGSSDTGTQTIDLTSSAEAAFESITIKNESGEYTVVPYVVEEEGEKVAYLKLKGYDNIPQYADMVTSIGDYVFSVTATKKLESNWTEEDCGLDKPTVLVTVKISDKESFTITIGKKTPEGTGYYCKTSLKEGIYVVSDDQYTRFSYPLTSYIDTVIIDVLEASGDEDVYFSAGELVRYDTITFSGTRFEQPIKLEYLTDAKEFLTSAITSPVRTYANDEKIYALLSPFREGMTAADAYVFNPTSEDLKAYGLDKPETVITYVIKEKAYTIRLSKAGVKDAGYYACTINDDPVIYKMTEDLYEFFKWELKDFRNTILFARELKKLKSLTLEYGGESIKYDVSVTTETDEAGNEINTYVITHNAKSVSTEDFQKMYSTITLVKASDYLKIGEKQPSGTPYIKLTYEYTEGYESDVVTFVKYNERYYNYNVNGIGDELVNYRTVDNLVKVFDDFRAGKTVASPT